MHAAALVRCSLLGGDLGLLTVSGGIEHGWRVGSGFPALVLFSPIPVQGTTEANLSRYFLLLLEERVFLRESHIEREEGRFQLILLVRHACLRW